MGAVSSTGGGADGFQKIWVCALCNNLTTGDTRTKLEAVQKEDFQLDPAAEAAPPAAARTAAADQKPKGAEAAAAAAANRQEKLVNGELTQEQQALLKEAEKLKEKVAKDTATRAKVQASRDDDGSDAEAHGGKGAKAGQGNEGDKSDGESPDDSAGGVMKLVKSHLEETSHADQALLIACAGGCAEAVKFCFDNGAVPSSSDGGGFTCGDYASLSGSVDALRELLEKDEHGEYAANFFDTRVAPDGMTNFMNILRHGNSEMYEFMHDKLGCKLKLLGGRFGKYDQGQSLDKWLVFLPEISDIKMVPKMRQLTLPPGKSINFAKKRRAEDLDDYRTRRLQVRRWVREKLHAQQEVAKEKEGAEEPSLKGRAGKQRMALAVADVAGALQQSGGNDIAGAVAAATGLFDVIASVVPPGELNQLHARGNHSEQSEDRGMWICGACFAPHPLKADLLTSQSLPCQKCSKVNFVGMKKDTKHDEKEEEEGEEWVNEGTEFANEENIEQLMGPMKRSVLWCLGRNKARELLRIVRVETRKSDDTIFIETEPLKSIILLTEGEVVMNDGHGSLEKIRAGTGGDGRTHILDEFALMRSVKDGKTARHSWTAKVASKEAILYEFDEKPIAEYMGHDIPGTLVHEALARHLVNNLKLFKHVLKDNEKQAVAKCLQYDILGQHNTIISVGECSSGLTIVSQGKLSMKNKKRSKTLHVGNDFSVSEDSKGGDKYEKVFAYVAGTRGLIFAVPTTEEIETLTKCQLWRLSPENVAHHCTCKLNLRDVLQTAMFSDHLRSTFLFREIPPNSTALLNLVMGCESSEYLQGDSIVKQGDKGEACALLVDGQVKIQVNDKEVQKLNSDVDADRIHHFGELSLISKQPRAATVIVASELATVLWVTVADIQEHFGSLEELLDRQKKDAFEAAHEIKEKLGISKLERDSKEAEENKVKLFEQDSKQNKRVQEMANFKLERHVPNPKAKAKAKEKLEAKAKAKAEAKAKGKADAKAKSVGGKIRASISNIYRKS